MTFWRNFSSVMRCQVPPLGKTYFIMFLNKYDLDWKNCLAMCTDGTPLMIGSRVGFVTHIKTENPDVIIIHCLLHRENLASRRLQPDLHAVLSDAIQIVNFIKARALNSHIFHKMCEEMGSHYKDLLFHSDVRWLSRGKILARVLELKSEIEIFLYEKRHTLADCFKDAAWLAKLAYLSDIFTHLNELNLDMQGRNHTMVDIGEKIVSFKKKLALWREKLAKGKIAAFPELSAMLEDSSDIFLPDIRNIVEDHLRNLQEEMDRYIPENVDLKKHSWIRNAFTVNVTEVGEDIPGFQEELIDLQGNQVQKQRFENLQCSKI
ncbi:zinc finger BED domain-containing protein 5-like isoform X1 [Oratosquilla oratoria]|uniref:zinc finger BED domain-containing protein 5-like isoform X1 n=1 Tax=Oratosquilla oratoria TaxID=337810 RepID=UPI003F77660A